MTNLKESLLDTKIKPNTAFENELREKLPQFFTAAGEFDIEKFRDNLSQNNVKEIKDGYTLNYVGKTYARLQTGQPTKTVIIPDQKHNKLSENKDSKNVFLTGDNLDVLKHLQKAYSNSIDFIYIDPPYNTGSDGFVYNDRFNLTDDQLRDTLNFTDDEINRLKILNGRSSHSAWLTFMYPRLKVAQQLLKDTGVIFVSIDDNEQANLKLLMDDIFGEGNFIANVIWQHSIQPKGYLGNFSIHHNHTLVYSKTQKFELGSLERTEEHNKAYSNPDNDPNGDWRSGDVRNALYRPNLIYPISTPSGKIIEAPEKGWRWSKETIEEKIKTGEIIFSEDETRIIRKIYLNKLEGRAPETIWFGKEVGTTRDGNRVIKELFDGVLPFDTPKPVELIKKALQLSNRKDAIVLDFFAGSGTTAHATMQLNAEDDGNRQFILATIDEPANSDVARSAGFDTIDQISRERIRRAAQKIKNENPDTNIDLGFKHFLVKDVEANTIDKIVEFDPNVLFVDDMVAEFAKADLGATGADTILQTWLIGDGYKFDTEVTEIKFADNIGYQVDNLLYIIDDFKQDDVHALLNAIGQHKLPISTIIVFGYSVDFTTLTSLKNNTKTTLDGIKVEVRY